VKKSIEKGVVRWEARAMGYTGLKRPSQVHS
jgi:hypothetical protein